MIYSKHNIFSKIKDSENYFIVNLLNGSADILEPNEGQMLKNYIVGNEISEQFTDKLTENGYIVDDKEENRLYRNEYLSFLDKRDDEEDRKSVV